jgi:hypothetical protein
MDISSDNMYYGIWPSSPRFVSAHRVAFELRLRIPTPWSDEDEREADFFAGDLPAAERIQAGNDSRLEAIYGPTLRVGDVKQLVRKQNLWRTKHQVEDRFLVLRQTTLLIYKERAVVSLVPNPTPLNSLNSFQSTHSHSRHDQSIHLRAVREVSTVTDAESTILVATATKSFPLLFESVIAAREWIRLIREAANQLRASPKRGRINPLERVNHLTTQITLPSYPYASGGFANVYKGTWEVADKGSLREAWVRRTVCNRR